MAFRRRFVGDCQQIEAEFAPVIYVWMLAGCGFGVGLQAQQDAAGAGTGGDFGFGLSFFNLSVNAATLWAFKMTLRTA